MCKKPACNTQREDRLSDGTHGSVDANASRWTSAIAATLRRMGNSTANALVFKMYVKAKVLIPPTSQIAL